MTSKSPEKSRSRAVHNRSVSPKGGEGKPDNTRRTRQRHAQELKEEKIVSPYLGDNEISEAGPSSLTSPRIAGFGDEDFIPFVFEEEQEEEGPVKELEPGEPTLDSSEVATGKRKAPDYEGVGRKRKSDEMERDESYATLRERIDTTTRRAPWAANVDWDSCRNVAEMCVGLSMLIFMHLF
jgi:hypothetical protein